MMFALGTDEEFDSMALINIATEKRTMGVQRYAGSHWILRSPPQTSRDDEVHGWSLTWRALGTLYIIL